MIVRQELLYEYWDCKYCSLKAVRGDEERCTGCGHDRDRDITFYRLEAGEELVQDGGQAARFLAGPDWACGYCGALTAQLADRCRACGAARKDAAGSYFETRPAPRGGAPTPAEGAPVPDLLPHRGDRYLPMLAAVLALLAVVGGGVYFWLTRTHEVAYEVVAARWERSVSVLRYGWAERADWDDEISGDEVQRLAEQREVRRGERRQVGTVTETYTEKERYESGTRQECTTEYASTGSGAAMKTTSCRDVPEFGERDVTRTREVPAYEEFPIYGNKVRYRAKRYQLLRTDKLQGDDNAPRWPDPALGMGEDGKPDQESERAERYQVRLRKADGGRAPEDLRLLTMEAAFVGRHRVGQRVQLSVSNMGRPQLLPGDRLEEDGEPMPFE